MSAKRTIWRIGIILGCILLLVAAAAIYLYSILPKPIGETPEIQSELFEQPVSTNSIQTRYIYRSAHELSSMVRHQEASATDIAKEFIAYIKNNNWKYNAIAWLDEPVVLSQAAIVDEAVARGDTNGALLGVPVTIKEQYLVKGYPTTLNNKQITVYPDEDASLVRQIRTSGAIILGTTNIAYMANDFQTFGEVYPTANNPYDTSRTPGGSTGGGAAALAAGFTTLELGTDMAGSIRVPASFCGLWGLKPGFGSLNTTGLMPLPILKPKHFGMACPGPMTRSAGDLELFWNVLRDDPSRGPYQKDIHWASPSNKSLDQYRIAWKDQWENGGTQVAVSEESREKLKVLLTILQNSGSQLKEDIPNVFPDLEEIFTATLSHILCQDNPRLLRELMIMKISTLLGENTHMKSVLKTHMRGCSEEQWQQVQDAQSAIEEQFEEFFDAYDFLITHAVYGPAFVKCEGCSELQLPNGEYISYIDYFSYSYAFSAAGNPCLVVPMGLNSQGLPIDIQVVGPYGSEPELLHFAQLIEPLVPGFIRP